MYSLNNILNELDLHMCIGRDDMGIKELSPLYDFEDVSSVYLLVLHLMIIF